MLVLVLLTGMLWQQADAPLVIVQRVFEQDQDGSNKELINSFQIGECDIAVIDPFDRPVTTYCDRIVIRVPVTPLIFQDGFE